MDMSQSDTDIRKFCRESYAKFFINVKKLWIFSPTNVKTLQKSTHLTDVFNLFISM